MSPGAVRLFGRPVLSVAGRSRYLGPTQGDRFLAYLAVSDAVVARDEAIFLFWPDRVDAAGRRNLRKLLHRARKEFDDIDVDGDLLRWRIDSDLHELRTATSEGDGELALALAPRPLLEGLDAGAPDEYLRWLDEQRERTRGQLVAAVETQCRKIRELDPQRAAELALGLLNTDPLDERAVACCLTSMAVAGRTVEAGRIYDRYVRLLHEELGVAPSVVVEEAYRHASRGIADDLAVAADDDPRRGPASVQVAPVWGNAAFVGRGTEIAYLTDRLASALAGDGGIVAVEGEAGVGKTRLVEAFLADLPSGVAAFAGRCYERDLSAPLEPVRSALGEGAAVQAAPAPDPARFVGPERREASGLHATLTARLTAAAALGRGAVLFLDDLQWADAATLDFLAYAAHRTRDQKVLIVVSHRREDRLVLERWKAHLAERRVIRTMHVGRFGVVQTRSLIAEVLGGDDNEVAGFAEFVHAESEGNPFYVLEYLRWLRDRQLLGSTAAPAATAPSRERLAEAAVPETIRSLIWARYRSFGSDTRVLLDAAAVIGRAFDLDLLERTVAITGPAFWAALEPVIAAGLLVPNAEGVHQFSHDKLRQTVYESLAPPVRKALHAAVGEALSNDGASDAELAHHALRAELWHEAYQRLGRAAAVAEADSAWEVAREAHARILAIVHRLEDPDRKRFTALQASERMLEFLARRPEWMDVIKRLTEVADRIGDSRSMAEAALKRMAMLSVHGDRVGAEAAFQRANSLFESVGDPGAQARAYRDVAYLAWMRGDDAGVIEASHAAMAIDQELGNRSALAATAENVAHAYRWLGDHANAASWAEEAASRYDELGSELAAYVRLDHRAWVQLERDDVAEATTTLERLLPLCYAMEDKHLVVEKHMGLGKLYLRSGQYRQALDSFEAARILGAATGDLRHEGYPTVSCGVALEGLGRHEEAASHYLEASRLLETAYAVAGSSEDDIGQGDALVLHAGVARRRLGRHDAASSSLERAEQIFRRADDPQRLSLVQMEQGALCWSTGDLDRAAEAYRDASETSVRAGMTERAIAARASLAVSYRDLGRATESIDVASDAVERIRRRDDPLGQALLLSSLASCYQRAGRAEEARSCLEESLTLRRACGDERGAQATVASLASLADAAPA